MSKPQTLPPLTSVGTPREETRRQRILKGRFTPIWIITVILFAVSPLIAPGSLTATTLASMLPFAGILAIVALGQTLVMSQGGIDLSVPGSMALAAVLVTKLPEQGMPLPLAVAVALFACALGGLAIGISVVALSVAAFISSLAINSVLLGVVLFMSNGFPAAADPGLSAAAVGSVAGIPTLVLIAVAVVLVAHVLVRHTLLGRRLIAVGASRPAAKLQGIRVQSYEISAYVCAGLVYALGGILLAGLLRTPNIMLGDTYLLPSIAAVVLGGSLLTGGITSVVATAVAALFLTQLSQVVLVSGATTSTQLLVQALVLAASVVFRGFSLRGVLPTIGRPRKPSSAPQQPPKAS